MIFIKYVPCLAKIGPKWKMLRIYWNLAEFIFQICWSRFRCQKWFLLNIYHLLGQNLSQSEKWSEFWNLEHCVYNLSQELLIEHYKNRIFKRYFIHYHIFVFVILFRTKKIRGWILRTYDLYFNHERVIDKSPAEIFFKETDGN